MNLTDVSWVFLSLLLPVAGIISVLFAPQAARAKINLVFVALTALTTTVLAFRALTGGPLNMTLCKTPVFGNIQLRVDGLAAWFMLIINVGCINGAAYGVGYMKQYERQKTNLTLHWILFLLFQASMLWVCMVQNTLAFLAVWELMSISSFLLVIFDHGEKKTLQAGINYLIQMHIGVMILSVAFIWVWLSEGSFDFSAIEKFFASHTNTWLFLLFFTGFGIKAGFIPLHTWLPLAHPAAPSHVSGVMSGVIVKLGIYGIFRILFMLKQDEIIIGEIVIILSVCTSLFGILNAAVHRDFKKMLAYCTIENIGITGIGMGIGILGLGTANDVLAIIGFAAALLHALNHSLYKPLLFFASGAVYQQTRTRDMERLGGLMRTTPRTAIFFLLGGMAISGLPPLNGFVSEFLLYSGILLGIKSLGIVYIALLISALAGLSLTGGISMFTFTKGFGTIFLGSPRTNLPKQPVEVSFLMQLPQYFLVLIMLSISLFPQYYFLVVQKIVAGYIPAASGKISLPAISLITVAAIGKVALLFMLLLLVTWLVRKSFTRNRPESAAETWGCGYPMATARMQYTGKSFSKAMGKLLSFILLEQKKYREISTNEILPEKRKYSSHYNDFFAKRIYDKVTDRLIFSMNYFQFIQNGKIQSYILYGIFFIVLVFLATIVKLI
ncbi:MAG TPA: proton-conducting transporter membrane subunit [Chitinophagaceae bacterium]|nr:proton-conducting transporter membrane subunit [Chitinophagaceae bacterium]